MRFAGCVLAFVLALSAARAREPANTGSAPPPAATAVRELGTGEAVALGLVEGITEFLPVSSTGHLIIANHFLGLEDTRQLCDARGQPLWIEPPGADEPAGVPLTRKTAADTFTVVIQIGGIAAVVVLYWNRLWAIALGALGMNRDGALLLRNIVLGVLPAVVLGLTLDDWIEEKLFGNWPVIAALLAGALLMLYVEFRRRHSHWMSAESRRPADLKPSEALFVGAMQCVAMWPGTSRSMMTIVGGYIVGLKPAQAAEFSFLLGLPTLAGAALLKGVKTGPAMIQVFGWAPVLLGTLVAFLSAALAIKVLVAALTRFGLTPFAVYRIVLAVALAAVLVF